MASTNPETVAWAAGHGMSLVGLGPGRRWKPLVDLYREAARSTDGGQPKLNGHVPDPRIGLSRQAVVAESDEAAVAIARRAHPHFARSFVKLWEENDDHTVSGRVDLDASMSAEAILIGSPDSVTAMIERTVEDTGIDYLCCSFAWGTLSIEEAERSMELFATEVMPRFARPQPVNVPTTRTRTRRASPAK